MRVISTPGELGAGGRRVCAAIGVFDGVHLGHQQVIRQTVSDARGHNALSVAVTFDRHPNSVVAPARAPRLIYSLPQKLRAIESLGVDAALVFHFDEAFSRTSGEQFVRDLARGFGQIHSISVGSNFTFGHKRQGNVELLQRMGKDLKFSVHGLAAVALAGKVVSSTRIREAISIGELHLASQMLGRAYSIAGRVMEGDRLGRTLGFPTANMDAAQLSLPPSGVYAVLAQLVRTGEVRKGALNIGLRPTLGHAQPQLRIEAHLIDFSGGLYDQELEITFVERIRGEEKFPSLDALKAQITRDIAAARVLLD